MLPLTQIFPRLHCLFLSFPGCRHGTASQQNRYTPLNHRLIPAPCRHKGSVRCSGYTLRTACKQKSNTHSIHKCLLQTEGLSPSSFRLHQKVSSCITDKLQGWQATSADPRPCVCHVQQNTLHIHGETDWALQREEHHILLVVIPCALSNWVQNTHFKMNPWDTKTGHFPNYPNIGESNPGFYLVSRLLCVFFQTGAQCFTDLLKQSKCHLVAKVPDSVGASPPIFRWICLRVLC